MRNGAQILVISGLFAATVIAALVLFVSNVPQADPVPATALPSVSEPQKEPALSLKTYPHTELGFSV